MIETYLLEDFRDDLERKVTDLGMFDWSAQGEVDHTLKATFGVSPVGLRATGRYRHFSQKDFRTIGSAEDAFEPQFVSLEEPSSSVRSESPCRWNILSNGWSETIGRVSGAKASRAIRHRGRRCSAGESVATHLKEVHGFTRDHAKAELAVGVDHFRFGPDGEILDGRVGDRSVEVTFRLEGNRRSLD